MRKLYNVITVQDSDGIREICLVQDDDKLIQRMESLVKLLKLEIKNLKEERKTG